MEAIVLRTPPGGRFHFGNVTTYTETALEETATVPHADVLFSALVNILAQTEPDSIPVFLDWVRMGKLRLSSACYVLEDQKTDGRVWFLPKPVTLNLWRSAAQTDNTDHKKLKAIQFLSRGVWEQGLLPDEWFRKNGPCVVLQNSFVALKTELPGVEETLKSGEGLTLFRKQTSPKVKARNPDLEKKDGFYHQTDLQLTGSDTYRVGWYFLLDHQLAETERQYLDKWVSQLCLTGIGGERSTGCGALTEHESYPWPELAMETTEGFVTLSLTIPADETDLKMFAYYQVKQRGGRPLNGQLRTRQVQALAEGAVLTNPDAGSLIDLSPMDDLPILRYGYAFTIPLHRNYWLV